MNIGPWSLAPQILCPTSTYIAHRSTSGSTCFKTTFNVFGVSGIIAYIAIARDPSVAEDCEIRLNERPYRALWIPCMHQGRVAG